MSYIIDTSKLELKRNKVTSIDALVTDEQYPSARAVFSALEGFTPPPTTTIEGDTCVNNSEYSVSFGEANYAGYMCHKILSYDTVTLTLILDSDANTLAVNDVISIDGGNNYPYCATVTSINGNTITVDKAIVDYAGNAMNPTTEDHLLYVDDKPNTGTNPLGEGQVAIGLQNHAIAKATTAIGRKNYASGGYAIALGRENKAANYSVALGRKNKATGFNSTALGFQTIASGIYSTSLGYKTEASGDYSLAAGSNSKASGANAIALGDATEAQGTYSLSLGHQAIANGYAAMAIGNPYPNGADENKTVIQAVGDLAIAYGQGCQATASQATARGLLTKAKGSMSVAIGQQSEASGTQSFAGGLGSLANGARAFAFGKGLNTSSQQSEQTVFGRFNSYDNEALFIVGMGEDESARCNAFTVKSDGSATLQTMGSTDNSVVTKAYADSKMDKFGNVASVNGYNYIHTDYGLDLTVYGNFNLKSAGEEHINGYSITSNGSVLYDAAKIELNAGLALNGNYTRLELNDDAGEFYLQGNDGHISGYDTLDIFGSSVTIRDIGTARIVVDPNGITIGGLNQYATSVKIHDLVTPTNDYDAANKLYVDNTTEYIAKKSTTYSGCFYRTVDGVTEWLNPPMIVNTEYKTVERYHGKPVYVQEFFLISLPNTTYVTHEVDANDVDEVCSATLTCAWSNSGKTYTYATSKIMCMAGVDDYNRLYISIDSPEDMSHSIGYVTVKYTKTTDTTIL